MNNIKFKIERKLGKGIIDKIPFIIMYFVLVYIHRSHVMDAYDDSWFQKVTSEYSLVNYLKLRYFGWTGRMASETFYYFIFRDGGRVWKIINPLFIVVTVFAISRIVNGRSKNNKNKFVINCYICICWAFISKSVILNSIMWMSGSIVYLWSMTFALIAIIPFRDALLWEYNENLYKYLYIICAFLASLGEEQVSLVLLAFITIINIHIYVINKKVYKYLLIQNIVTLIGTIILFRAPGNYIRNAKETINWLPNYNLYNKWEIAFNGIQWLLSTLLNDSNVIFLMIILALSICFYKSKYTQNNKIYVIIPLVGSLLIIAANILSIDKVIPPQMLFGIKFPPVYEKAWEILNKLLFDFNTPNPFALKKITIIKFLIWPIVIGTVPYFVFRTYKFSIKGVYLSLIYIASICSAAIMFKSATIYASGTRTFYVSTILFLILFIYLIKDLEFFLRKKFVFILLIISILKCIYMFAY
ncbi:hypothetical protein SAMN02745134_01152 [Clostridium acidisoli DSM 12555]|uniref:Uncharacterized protein n=1 Tax=Clostridium acidisoli DSM 12555 TaxID=1121291 RepID=A0A1W1XAR1_9CLOT|nr:DUF6056 family protein [Clostridium acidisoli]SMC20937.1 hypothetical protein SAMN02745134_01152 [Clostridium acidisoli DSM 12555]